PSPAQAVAVDWSSSTASPACLRTDSIPFSAASFVSYALLVTVTSCFDDKRLKRQAFREPDTRVCSPTRTPGIGFPLSARRKGSRRSRATRRVEMTHAQQMLETHPRTVQVDAAVLVGCIDACFDCAQSCTACADACLGEPDAQMMLRCISLCENC